jgi:hypothetical protein
MDLLNGLGWERHLDLENQGFYLANRKAALDSKHIKPFRFFFV